MNLSTFLAMGGYAAYVWPSLGITLLVLAGLSVVSVRALKRTEADLRAIEATGRDGLARE